MAFIIEAVATDHTWVPLTLSADPYGNNVFSLVVGQNATGKSRLLRKIASHYIFDNEQLSDRERYQDKNNSKSWSNYSTSSPSEELILSPYSEEAPSIVIAVSTGRHDRFPKPRETMSLFERYHYIAPSEHGNLSSLTRSLASIISGLEAHSWKFSSMANIFEYLDFEPLLEFNVTLDPKFKQYWRKQEAEEQAVINLNEDSYSLSKKISKNQSVIDRLYPILKYINNRKSINYEIHLTHGSRTHHAFDLRELAYALEQGAVRVTDLTLSVKSTKSRLKLSQASSGQQCMLVMILGIAGSIQDDALICIDEPEISLHPQWQSDIIGHLQKAFEQFKGCHFVIATHSPQIVAGLTSDNGYVLSLEDKTIYKSHEYANRSADFQLAQVFNTPGFNNEYLIRIALMLLTKISRRATLTNEDEQQVIMLLQVRERLSSRDPVRHLIDQVQMLR
ncbi:AAA ATPase domain-containing protein [Pseudomonas guariconensis]|uniref:AAA family ATPase n=1 Tax=Pseudomonas guariconensis TaxID=1288410 RepID=UPI000883C68F|nr:AAA family ATPase [Pseudomonas guariconensis]SDC87222.1 AAA ATPase domain-containing protein [Pseudomonas guariconensis]